MRIRPHRSDQKWRDFYRAWFRGIFHKPSWVEYVATFFSVISGSVALLWPALPLVRYFAIAPIVGFCILGLLRIASAPYELWRDQNRQITALRHLARSTGDDRRQRFETAVLELRYIVSAREMWWRQMHRRDGESTMWDRLHAATDAIRLFFPPQTSSGYEDDPISALHKATSNLCRAVGYDWKGDHLAKPQLAFEEQLVSIMQRFEKAELQGTQEDIRKISMISNQSISESQVEIDSLKS